VKEIDIRLATERDLPFVFSSWLNHYKNFSSFARRIRKELFMKTHHKVVELILLRSSTKLWIATPKGEPDVIVGFLAAERFSDTQVVHFIFVKEAFRRLGIAQAMMKEAEISIDTLTFTHWTYEVDSIAKRFPEIVYDPYRL
jgi:hypothetical protein